MLEEAITLFKETDSYATIDFLGRQDDAQEVIRIYNQLVKRFYYEEKDIQAVIVLARAGAQYGLAASQAAEKDDPALEAGEPAEALLSDGFGALVTLLASPDDYNAQAQLTKVIDKLSSTEDGQFFIEQLETAEKVFVD